MDIQVDLLEIGIELYDQPNDYNNWENQFISECYKRKKIKISDKYAKTIYNQILYLKIKPTYLRSNDKQNESVFKKIDRFDLNSQEESFEEYFAKIKNDAVISEAIELYRQAIERYEYINQAKLNLKIPSTIPYYLLNDSVYNRHIPAAVKQFVWERANGICEKCGGSESLEFDHIIPVSKGGSNSEKNIQVLCEKCNRKKSNKIE